ncbi:MAG: putative lipid II flippase FtsW [Gammaproteobacteria bacterium]|nr:putative lipid II flippase FtsW [Gammaproteobacteria bacterium]
MKNKRILNLDPVLTIGFTLLFILGLLILTSASMPMAEKTYNLPFYFFYNQMACLCVGLVILSVFLFIDTSSWQQLSTLMLYIVLFLLLTVLLLGTEVNGAKRWLSLPGLNLQVSEILKLVLVLYLADFIDNYYKEISVNLQILVVPLLWLLVAGCLLLAEPDFGATVVLVITFMGMIFVAGISLRPLLLLGVLAVILLGGLAYFSPYRLARLTTFLHPWDYAYSSGYQLTQALISYGRGDWLGLGLGGSIQKLFFLPEAHTDFIFSILAEELGLFGAIFIIFLYLLVILRILYYGVIGQKKDFIWQAFICYGAAFYFMAQSFISIGVNLGLLPTKGLTLPLMSYGRCSLLINCAFIGIVLRAIMEIKAPNRN